MCYLVAKDFEKRGCFAWKTRHGQELADLVNELNHKSKGKGIQLVTISRPTAYGEYAPYQFVDTKEELIGAVEEMVRK